jgi:hypothetical protein
MSLDKDPARKKRMADRRESGRIAATIREGWSDEQREAEAGRITEEIAARLAAGQITRCPAMWAKGVIVAEYFISQAMA